MSESKRVETQYRHQEFRFTATETSKSLPPGSYRAVVLLRYDDNCHNGYNTFGITTQVYGPNRYEAFGCNHDVVQEFIPELAHCVKWHLCGSTGPMHYVANAVYLAGNRDHNGRRDGEVSRYEYGVRFGNSPVTHKLSRKFNDFLQARAFGSEGSFQVFSIAHDREPQTFKPKYSLVGFAEKWHECPFDSQVEADEFAKALNTCNVEFVMIPVEYSQGKARELDSARLVAVWPDATDEQLCAAPADLKQMLEARLPGLLSEFQAFIESLGFTY